MEWPKIPLYVRQWLADPAHQQMLECWQCGRNVLWHRLHEEGNIQKTIAGFTAYFFLVIRPVLKSRRKTRDLRQIGFARFEQKLREFTGTSYQRFLRRIALYIEK